MSPPEPSFLPKIPKSYRRAWALTLLCGVALACGKVVGGTDSDDAPDGESGSMGGSAGGGAVACAPGTFQSGTAGAPVECAPCPSGTYSDTADASQCVAWTPACAAGFVEDAEGTATSDRSCSVLEWTREFGAAAASFDTAYSVGADDRGNVLVAGSVDGALPGQESLGNDDAFLRKYDPNGTELWTTQFGTDQHDALLSVIQTGGMIFLAGQTTGALPGQVGAGGGDVFLRKLGENGGEACTVQFGTSDDDYVPSDGLTPDADGGAVMAWATSDGTTAEYSYFLSKVDTSCTLLWTQEFGDPGVTTGVALALDGKGNVFAAGTVIGSLSGQPAFGKKDAFVRKYDASGNELWTRQFGSEEGDGAYSIRVDASGDVFVLGTTSGVLPGQSRAGDVDGFVSKYDGQGNEVWIRQFGTTEWDFPDALTVDTAGNVLIAGNTDGTFFGQTSAGDTDVFVLVYDRAGNLHSTRQLGTNQSDNVEWIAADAKGVILIAGDTQGTFPDQAPVQILDAFVARLAP